MGAYTPFLTNCIVLDELWVVLYKSCDAGGSALYPLTRLRGSMSHVDF